MIKKFLYLFFVAVILTGCSFNPLENNSNVLSEDSGRIIWWGLFEEKENLQPLIDRFIEDNPGIEVEYIIKDKQTYAEELNAVLMDNNINTTPDIFMIHNTWVGNYSSYSSTAPSGTFAIEDFQNDFHDFVSEDFGYDNQVRGVPLWVDMLGIIYHKDILNENAFTVIANEWNDFYTQATAMTQIDESGITRAGFSGGISENVEFSFEVMNLLMLQSRELEFTKEDLDIPFSEDEEQKVEDAFTFYKTFNTNSWNSSFKLDTAEFIESDLVSFISPSWRLYDILRLNEEKNLNLEIATSEVPQLDTDSNSTVNLSSYWGYVVSKDSTKSTASWRLLKFLSEKETQELYMDTVVENGRPFALISPRKDLLSISEENQYLKNYVNSIPYTHSWYMINNEKLKEVYEEVLDGSSVDSIITTFTSIKENENVL